MLKIITFARNYFIVKKNLNSNRKKGLDFVEHVKVV